MIAGDAIDRVTDAGQDWPADATVLDWSGRTVIPGLIDAHAHVFHSGSPWWVGDTLAANLAADLAWGVLAVADVGGPVEVADLRDRIAAGTLLGPRLWVTGPFLTAVGSHPCETGYDRSLCRFVDGDAAEQVAALGDTDGYKVALADADFTDWPTPRLDLGDLAEIAAAAGDKPVLAHIDEEDDALDALANGVTLLAHPVFASDLDSFPDAPFTTTTGAFSGTGDLLDGSLLADDLSRTPEGVVEAWTFLSNHPDLFVDGWIEGSADWAEHARNNVALAIAEGRTVLAGTDAGYWFVPHGLGLHRELEVLVDLGMSPQQALAAATLTPAAFYGWDDLGLVAEGYAARLVALDADPLADIRATREIAAIVLDGEVLDADALEGLDPWVAAGDGTFCLDDRDCDDGACDLVDHQCREACEETYDRFGSCDAETWCMPQDGLDTTAEGVCHPGDDCDLIAQDCEPAYYGENCVPIDIDTNRCWPGGPREAGQSCSWTDPDLYCEPGLFCSWVTYRCYELCDPDDPRACPTCTVQEVEGHPWFAICL